MSEPDELYTLRNLFWLGNFQVCAHTLHQLPPTLQSRGSGHALTHSLSTVIFSVLTNLFAHAFVTDCTARNQRGEWNEALSSTMPD